MNSREKGYIYCYSLMMRMFQELLSALLVVNIMSQVSSQSTALPGITSECPQDCNCTLDNVYSTIDCSQRSLLKLPSNLPNTTLSLNLSGNNLYNISQDAFDGTPLLQALDLSFNPNLSLGENLDLFEALKHLHSLNLQATGLQINLLRLAHFPQTLKSLSLGQNTLTNVLVYSDGNQSLELRTLDIHNNRLTEISKELFVFYPKLHTLYADWNNIQHFQLNFSTWETSYFDSVIHISLSHNKMDSINPGILVSFPRLGLLDLSYNNILNIDGVFSKKCLNLKWLSLAQNPIENIPDNTFNACNNLTHLNLSGLNVAVVQSELFVGLTNLLTLDFSYSSIVYIYPDALSPITKLDFLDLSYNLLTWMSQEVFSNYSFALNSTQDIRLNGNPWNCDCNIQWLATWFSNSSTYSPHDLVPTCSSPNHLKGLSIEYLPLQFNCSNAQIINHTRIAFKRIGESVTLDCVVVGNPAPHVIWLTPTKRVFRYQLQYKSHQEPSQDHALPFIRDTTYNNAMIHKTDLHSERIKLLPNGSLHIDFVNRSDAGHYTCRAFNEHGNSSVVIEFTLNYLILLEVKLWSILCGVSAAAGMLCIGILVGSIHKIYTKCSRSEKEKRKGIAQVLQTLNDYRSVQIGKLSAKIDQISAFKNSKVDKLRMYKQASFQSIVQHMHNVREHYTSQVAKVKDNCSQQVEKLRENYSSQAGKFRTYKSTKVGKLRGYKSAKMDQLKDQYNTQALKIREYGSQQMSKLRDQHKLQQQHLLKLLELLDIGNCMGYIESECLRTDSMIFSENFMDIDLETHPVHVSLPLCDSTSDNSEYITASSHSDISLTGSLENINSNSQHQRKAVLEVHKEQNPEIYSQEPKKKSTRTKRKRKKRNTPKLNRNAGCETLGYTVKSSSPAKAFDSSLITSINPSVLASDPEVVLNITEHKMPEWRSSVAYSPSTSSEDVTPNYSPTFSTFPSGQSSPEKLYIQSGVTHQSDTGQESETFNI